MTKRRGTANFTITLHESTHTCGVLPYAVDAWAQLLKDGHAPDDEVLLGDEDRCVLAQELGTYAGCIVYRLNETNKSIYAALVHVAPQHRRKGLQQSMMNKLEDLARKNGYDGIEMSVFVGNENMHAAAAKAGFKPACVYYTKAL